MAQYDLDAARIARQRAIAQALAASGNQGFDPAASAGRMVYARSPWEDINKVAQSGLGAYLASSADKKAGELDARKTADLESQQNTLLDQVAGQQNLQTAPSQDPAIAPIGMNPQVKNPLTGQDENMMQPGTPGTVDANPKRSQLAALLKGADPQAAVDLLRNQSLSKVMPAPKPPMILAEGSSAWDQNTGALLFENPKDVKDPVGDRLLVDVVDPNAPGGFKTIKREEWEDMGRPQRYYKPSSNVNIAGMGDGAFEKHLKRLEDLERAKAAGREGGKNDVKVAASKVVARGSLNAMNVGIDRTTKALRKLNDDEQLWQGVGLTQPIGKVPGTAGARIRAEIGAIMSQLSIRAIEDMRANSKSGGAVGQVTETEWPRLAAQFGALSEDMSVGDFRAAAREIITNLEGVRTSAERAFYDTYGEQAPGAASDAPQVGEVVDGFRFKGGDPKAEASWEKVN